MSLADLKMEAATLGISRPDGHKGLKATWIAAIKAAAAATKSSPDKKKLQVLGDIGNKMQAEELEVLLREEREARVAAEARAVTAEARAVAAEASVSEEREARIAAEARADAMEIINRDLLEQSGEGKSEDQLKRELLGVGSEVGAWGATGATEIDSARRIIIRGWFTHAVPSDPFIHQITDPHFQPLASHPPLFLKRCTPALQARCLICCDHTTSRIWPRSAS